MREMAEIPSALASEKEKSVVGKTLTRGVKLTLTLGTSDQAFQCKIKYNR